MLNIATLAEQSNIEQSSCIIYHLRPCERPV
jgi:hypothetical protein